MDIFNGDLETIKEFCFGVLYFGHKVFSQILINDTIACREEGQNVRDEVTLTIIEIFPITKILAQVNFLRRPKARFGLLVKLPDVVLAYRKQYKTVYVFF